MRIIVFLSFLLHITNFISGLIALTSINISSCYDAFIFGCGSVAVSGLLMFWIFFAIMEMCCNARCRCCNSGPCDMPDTCYSDTFNTGYQYDEVQDTRIGKQISVRHCVINPFLFTLSLVMTIWGGILYPSITYVCDLNLHLFFFLTFWMHVMFLIIETGIIIYGLCRRTIYGSNNTRIP